MQHRTTKSSLADKLRQAIRVMPKHKWVPRPEILLSPNIPKPLHGVAPRVILGSQWWDKTRQAAYASTDYHCIACGVWKMQAKGRQWLEGHELYDIDYTRGRMTYVETVPLCRYCHSYLHDGRLEALFQKGQITQAQYVAVLQHGDRVLRMAGLSKESLKDRDEFISNLKLAEWSKWRLVIDGKMYPPKFKSFEEWKRAFE